MAALREARGEADAPLVNDYTVSEAEAAIRRLRTSLPKIETQIFESDVRGQACL